MMTDEELVGTTTDQLTDSIKGAEDLELGKRLERALDIAMRLFEKRNGPIYAKSLQEMSSDDRTIICDWASTIFSKMK